MAKTPKAERVRKLNLQMARIASAVIRIDRKIESFMDAKATELETFDDQLEIILTPEPEGPSAN